MKINRMYIRGFGRLRDVSQDFADDFNLLYGCNESGKTTTLEFILAMLYGFPSGRIKNIEENRRIHYLPWRAPQEYGGILTVTHNGIQYEIDRSFGEKKSQDRTSVIRTASGEALSLGKKEPGEVLLSMTRGEFLNTAFIFQTDPRVQSDQEIESKLMRTVSGTQGEGSAREMEAALTAYRKELDNERSRTPTVRAAAVLQLEERERRLEQVHAQEVLRKNLAEENERAKEWLHRLEKERAQRQGMIHAREVAEQLENGKKLLARWDELDTLQKENRRWQKEQGLLPDAAELSALKEAHRNWEARALHLASVQVQETTEDPEQLAMQIREGQRELDAITELEQEGERLGETERDLQAAQAEEERLWEALLGRQHSLCQERTRLTEARATCEQQLHNTRTRYEAAREKYAPTTQSRTKLPVVAGVLLLLGGVLLALFLTEPLWHLLSAAGVVLLLTGRRANQTDTEASAELLRDLEVDIRELEEALHNRTEALDTLPEETDVGPFVRSAALTDRQQETRKQRGVWIRSLAALGLEDPGEIGERKKGLASHLGSLAERKQRAQQILLARKEAETDETEAKAAFWQLGRAYGLEASVEEARLRLESIQAAALEQTEREAAYRRLQARIDEDRNGRTRKEVALQVQTLQEELQGREIPAEETAGTLKEDLSRIETELEAARSAEISTRFKLTEAQQDPVIPAVVEEEIRAARQEIARIDAEITAVDMALDVLRSSLQEMQESFGPELNRVTARHLYEMTQEEALEVSVDRDFTIKITDPETRARREQGYFSAGKIDQITLALRMAIAEVVYRKEGEDPLPLFLDDTLDQFDTERGHRTLRKLMHSAETDGHQILFATCHERIRDFVRAEKGTILELGSDATLRNLP